MHAGPALVGNFGGGRFFDYTAYGDTINIDVTVILDGWHGDTSRMYNVGKVGVQAQRLTDVTYEAMMRGIEAAQPGATLGDVGHAIQSFAEGEHGYGVVEAFCGHGIGKVFHTAPQIAHTGRRGTGMRMKPGMTFTIEPMINEGTHECRVLDDGWTAITLDGRLSAQTEHTILVTENGHEVLTMRDRAFSL